MKNIIKNPKCVSTSIEDSLIILNLDSGTYFEINKTGKEIWDLLNKTNSYDEIVTILKEKYPDITQIDNSVKKFLKNSKELNFLSYEL
tara:strand:+ start:487 stop:750 length:264 start_codon:yes stop_codon:yes gene_type:complete